MKKSIKIILIMILSIILFVIGVFIFYVISREEKNNKNEEVEYQIRYMSNKIIECIDSINLIDKSSPEKTSKEVNELYDIWNNLILSLSLNEKIEKSDINDFGQELDSLVLISNNKELQENLVLLYEKLINIYKKTNYDTKYKEIMEIRYYLMNSYILIRKGNWIEGGNNIKNASDSITQIFKDSKDNSYNINLIYISIKELEKAVSMQNYNIFYIKYNIVIKNLSKII